MTEYSYEYVYKGIGAEEEISRWIKEYKKTDDLETVCVCNGTILPRKLFEENKTITWMGKGGVVDENRIYVSMSGVKHLLYDDFVFGGAYDFDIEKTEFVDEEVIYIGPLFNHWGHFIYDFTTRLWYCKQNQHLRIAYCGWGFEEGVLHGSYKRFFELLAIDAERLIDVRKPTRFKKIIIPEPSYVRNRYTTSEYIQMMRDVADNIVCNGLISYPKVYFSRDYFIRRGSWYREYGEKLIQNIFELNGYKVFDPSCLSLDEQIFYMKNCKVAALIASSTGADTVFMKENTDRVYLKKSFWMDPDLTQIDYATDARKVTFVDCWLRPNNAYRGNHSAGPNMMGMTKELSRFISDNGMNTISTYSAFFHNVKVIIWFLLACSRNVFFSVFYSIYYVTARRIIRRH